jgi:peptidoglycan/LPS O-acetylase OafA/YrhL
VAAVLLFHGGVPGLGGGYLGVSTFFTLSGFLITSLLLVEHGDLGRVDLRRFWARRARRILPAALLTLGVVLVFGATAADEYQRQHLRGDVLTSLGFGVNWWFIATRRAYADVFGSPSPVQHFWSLAIEEQFYLVFPLIAAAALRGGDRRRFATVLAALLVASLGTTAWLVRDDASAARLYFGTDTRAAELLAGALLAVVLQARPAVGPRARRLLATLGVAALAFTVACWNELRENDARLYTGGLALYALASTVLVASAVTPGAPVVRLLAAAPLRWLGRISYGAYLFHFPLFLWLTPERTGLDGGPLLALRLAATLLAAQASHAWLEWPIRAGRGLGGRAGLVAAPAGAVGVVAATLLLGAPAPTPIATAVPMSREERAAAAIAQIRRHAPVPLPSATARTRILVVGDSVAAVIGEGLTRWASTTPDAAVVNLATRGCGIARGGWLDAAVAGRRAGCERWPDVWASRITTFRPNVVLVYSAGWDMTDRRVPGSDGPRTIGDPAFDAWLRAEYETALTVESAKGARVVWLNALCVRPPPIGRKEWASVARRDALNHGILEPMAAAHGDVMTLVDLLSRVCPGGRFTNEFGGVTNARPDGVHFSPAAADALATWLGPLLEHEAARFRVTSSGPP